MRRSMSFVVLIVLVCTSLRADAGVVTTSWQPTGGQAGAAFGSAVAPAGDVNGDGWSDVLVGAPLHDNGQVDEGRAYLYLGSKNGLAASPAWTFESNQAGAHAGAALASAGDVNYDGFFDVLVAAPDYDRPGHVDAGVVFVFYGSAAGLHPAPDDTLANDATGSHFGISLGFAGYTSSDIYVDVVIGAPGYSNGQANEGAIYVYPGGSPKLATTPSFTFESNEVGARAGQSVAGAGDVNGDGFDDLVVGEPGAAPGAHPEAGRTVILPGAAGGPTSTPIATVNGTEDSLAVGTGVAPAGDVDGDGYADVLVGVPGENVVPTRRGGFRCYRGTSSGLDPVPLFAISGMTDQGRAGAAVATAGDLDGDGYADFAFGDPFGFTGNPGFLHLFYGGRAGTAYGSFIVGAQGNSRFSFAVATAGDVDGDGMSELLVGAPDGGVGLEGTAYLFAGKPALPSIADNIPQLNTGGQSKLGSSLAILPAQISGSFPWLLVGEPSWDLPGTNNGRVRRLKGRAAGMTNAYDVLGATIEDGNFGQVVVEAGDVDRDGIDDFVVGSPFYTSQGINERGRALLYRNEIGSMVPLAWTGQGTQANERYGSAIAGRGDVNGDGYADIAIGAPYYVVPPQAGKVSVYLGGPGGPSAAPAWTKTGTKLEEKFGAQLAMLDFDGDGYSDLAVSATSSNDPPRVDIFFGGPGGLATNAAFSLSPTPAVGTYGSALSGVGDFDGDGVADLVVSALDYPNGQGTIYLYPGTRSRSTPTKIRSWTPGPGPAGAGWAIAGGGDLDGDGRADFVVGAPYKANPEQQEGVIYVFRGRAEPGPLAPDTLFQSDVAFRNLGAVIAPLADLNGDSYADIVASALAGDDGSLYAWLGGGEGAYMGLRMNESHFGGIGRFAPARLDSATQIGRTQDLRSAAGRARVDPQLEQRIEWTPFSNLPTYDPIALLDTSPPGPLGSVTGFQTYNAGLFPRAAYKMRGRNALNSPLFPHTRWVVPEGRLTDDYQFTTGGTVVGVPGGEPLAVAKIRRIAPNPARGTVQVAFSLPARAPLRLDVYDIRGRHVRTLARESLAGDGVRAWDGTDARGMRVPSGLYFVELRSGDTVDRGRIVLMD